MAWPGHPDSRLSRRIRAAHLSLRGAWLASRRFLSSSSKGFQKTDRLCAGTDRDKATRGSCRAKTGTTEPSARFFEGRRWRLPILIGARTSPERAGVKNPQSCEWARRRARDRSRPERGTASPNKLIAARGHVRRFPSHEENPPRRRFASRCRLASGKIFSDDADVCPRLRVFSCSEETRGSGWRCSRAPARAEGGSRVGVRPLRGRGGRAPS